VRNIVDGKYPYRSERDLPVRELLADLRYAGRVQKGAVVMSFPFEAVFSLGSKLVDLIGRFVPDRAKAQELAGEMNKLVGETIKAEVSSSGCFAQWRGMVLTVWGGAIGYRYAIGTLDLMDNLSDRAIVAVVVLAIMGYAFNSETIKSVFTLFGKPKQEEKK